MEKMTFTTDRTTLTEGEVITVTWDCHEAERVELTIDNGYKATPIALELTGTKRFRLNRSKGRTRLTVTAWVGGKSYSKTIKVKVTDIPTTHAETVDDKGNTISGVNRLTDKIGAWWRKQRTLYNERMAALSPEKRLAVRITRWLVAAIIILPLLPVLGLLALLAIEIYLLVFIRRR